MAVTTRCLGLVATATLLFVAGFLLGYPELALLGSAGGIAVLAALINAAWQPRLVVRRDAEPDRVSRGEPCVMVLQVRAGRRWGPVNVTAEDRCGRRSVSIPLLRMRPGSETTVRYLVPTDRRGVVPIGPLRVVRRDALGLVSLTRTHGEPARVWVHPRVHPMHAVPVGLTRSLDGHTDRVPHGSITFDSLREYVVGDELRRVHWRTTARVGRLMVREHLDTSLPRLVVLLDNRVEAHPGLIDGTAATFESACEAAASIMTAAARTDLPVTLVMVVDLPADGADAASGHPLDRLTAVTLRAGCGQVADAAASDPRIAGDGGVLRAAVARLRQQRLGDTVVFLTGPGDPQGPARVGGLRATYPVVLVGRFTGPAPPPAAGTAPRPMGAGSSAARSAPTSGMVVIDVVDGAHFAANWDGVGAL